jgi:putative membrane protein
VQSGATASPPLLAYFASGAVAICAMILPGVSGSFLLLMLGMYGAVIGAVHDRLLAELAVFAFGALIGLALFSTLLSWVLAHHRDTLLAALIGLMVGSLRVLWPWPNGVGVIGEEDEVIDGTAIDLPAELGDAVVPLVLGVIAFVVITALHRLAPSDHA